MRIAAPFAATENPFLGAARSAALNLEIIRIMSVIMIEIIINFWHKNQKYGFPWLMRQGRKGIWPLIGWKYMRPTAMSLF